MAANHRTQLLAILSKLDQLSAEADLLVVEAGVGGAYIGAMSEELRELIVEMRAKVEEKLDPVAE